MVHVVVVGAGLAGLCTCIAAVEGGATVTLLEKAERIGGNSAKATSGINGCLTLAQRAEFIEDSVDLFTADTTRSGQGGTVVPALVSTLTTESSNAIEWLVGFGVPLTVLTQLGGHSVKRTHRAPDKPDGTPTPIGFTIIRTLEKHIREQLQNSVKIETSSRVASLVKSGNSVTGIQYQKEGALITLQCDTVVLCTGGFSNDHGEDSLLAKYAPELLEMPTTNGPFATGDGVKLAQAVGASVMDMDKIQLHPTAFINPKDPSASTKFLGPEALRGAGGILINKRGERFVDELDIRSRVTAAIRNQRDLYPDSGNAFFAHCVLSASAATLFGKGSISFYQHLGLFTVCEDIESLASHIGCTSAPLRETLLDYENSSTFRNPCKLTGKVVYPAVVGCDGPYYVAAVTPAIHYTMGGCEISSKAEIIDNATREPIGNLFGAGEVTSGVHGGNRLGGNSLLECVVFGRIAGHRASLLEESRIGVEQ